MFYLDAPYGSTKFEIKSKEHEQFNSTSEKDKCEISDFGKLCPLIPMVQQFQLFFVIAHSTFNQFVKNFELPI